MSKKRLTIGLLLGNVGDTFSKSIARGAIEAAERLDVNVVLIPGRYIGLDYDTLYNSRYEYQFNTLFGCVNARNVDAVVAAVGSIAFACDFEQKENFLKKYLGIPVVTIAEKIGDFPSVTFNNKSGIAEAMDYLINVQGRRRIGMLSANLSNHDALERFEAYKETLAKNNIDFVEKRVTYGHFTELCEDAVNELLDNNPDLDAVVCANDAMATTLYAGLRERGRRIGDDIAVVGFDDLPRAAQQIPPLASVRASAETLGRKALELCISMKLGCASVSGDIYVDTKFIPRASAGGLDDEAKRVDKIFTGCSSKNVENITNEIVSIVVNSNDELTQAYQENKRNIARLISILYASFVESEAEESNVTEMLCCLRRGLQSLAETNGNPDMISNAVESLYKLVKKHMKDTEKNRVLLEKLYVGAYRAVTEYFNGIITAYKRSHVDFLFDLKCFMRDMLMFGNTYETSYATILKQLHTIGVRYSMLYIYGKAYVNEPSNDWKCPDTLYLKAIQDGRDVMSVPAANQEIAFENLFDNMFTPPDRRTTMLAVPLFSSEMQYGLFLCETKNTGTDYLDLMTYQLGAAAKIIHLLRQQNESLSRLNENNAELDAMAKLDELTHLLNRRGFYKLAKDRFNEAKQSGKIGVLAYVDTDHLKVINDMFGHNEGDAALKATADILTKTFRQSDIIGRIGGDEFIAFAVTDRMGFGDIARERLKSALSLHNAITGDKGYLLSMSMGIYEFRCTSTSSFDHAVEMADDFLYKCKKDRPADFSIIKK